MTTLATTALASIMLLSPASAGSGDLDPSFGSGGTVVTDFPAPAFDVATDVVVQTDGKLLVIGETTAETGRMDNLIVRYTAAGALDSTFGNQGMVKLDFAPDPEGGELVIQPDGKIVIVGSSSVVRLTANGAFDPTFDGDGRAVFSSGRADAVVLDSTGRIIVAGGTTVARYTSSGSLDTSFDGDGTATASGVGVADIHGVGLSSAGQIVVVGSFYPVGNDSDMALARFNSDGTLETTFGSGGIARVDFGGADLGQAIAMQSDDKIVVGGPHGSDFAIARLAPGGALDPSFDTDGRATFDLGGSVLALATQPDGKIVAAGGGLNKFIVVRVNPTGALDSTFDADGKQMTEFHGPSAVQTGALALQVDGKILVAGSAAGDFGIVRYTGGGALDSTFDTDGKVLAAFLGPTVNAGEDVAMQSDGKLVVVGTIAERDTAIARYTTAGALDPTFGTGGRVVLNADVSEFARAVAVQADGKILVAGASFGTTVDVFLFRLLGNGTLDTSFGTGGLVKTNVATGFLQANAIVIQPDTKILVAGTVFGAGADFLVLRYNADGTLDTSFGSGGQVSTDLFGSSTDVARGMALQGDGKIVVAGSTGKSGATGFPASVALARYDAAGALDATFDGDGKVRTLVGSFSRAVALAVRLDNRIVVAGLTSGTGGSDFLVLRYEQAGSLDPSFDGDGIVTTDVADGDQAGDLVIQPAGQVVVAGTSFDSSGASDVSVARYTENGNLDTTFSADGKTTTDVDQFDMAGGVVATLSAITVAGRTGGDTRPTAEDFLLIRYQLESVPGAVALSPPAAVNNVGTSHTVTATVTDTDEDPVADVTVRFTVTGSVTTSASCTTDANGQCGFTYTGPSLPGADEISAYADTDGDSVQETGEPVALPATKAWVLPASTSGQASGGGHITDATSGKVAFGFSAKSEDGTFHGQCNVIDPGNRMIKCLDVTALVVSGNEATIYGNATDNGVATTYVMKVADKADPGKGADTLSITTASGYSASGTLTAGNVQVE